MSWDIIQALVPPDWTRHPKWWNNSGTILEVEPHASYLAKSDVSGKVIKKIQTLLRKFETFSEYPLFSLPQLLSWFLSHLNVTSHCFCYLKVTPQLPHLVLPYNITQHIDHYVTSCQSKQYLKPPYSTPHLWLPNNKASFATDQHCVQACCCQWGCAGCAPIRALVCYWHGPAVERCSEREIIKVLLLLCIKIRINLNGFTVFSSKGGSIFSNLTH